MDSLVVIKRRWLEHGDQAADWTEPVGIVHRSGVHLFVCQTRKTPPTVDVNRRWLFGDHLAKAHGIPMRFNGIFRFVSTSHKIAFESLKLTDTNNEPLRFHSNELIGWWFVLNDISINKLDFGLHFELNNVLNLFTLSNAKIATYVVLAILISKWWCHCCNRQPIHQHITAATQVT